MQALYDDIARLAPASLPVIVTGETGTGKECVARALHAASGRQGRLVAINVAALPDALAESELFGSARGAFTGAVDRAGLIQQADRGTLVLDEAADLPHGIQVKLLRVLEDGSVRRVGSTNEHAARFRLVVTTQRDPELLREGGHWRQDFYFRVAGTVLRTPTLEERASDIPLLAAHFAKGQGTELSDDAVRELVASPWPGNVRQLRHAVECAASGHVIPSLTSLTPRMPEGATNIAIGALQSIEAIVAEHVRGVVAACAGDKKRAATILGLSPSQVYRRLQARTFSANSHKCETHSHGCELDSHGCESRT